MASKNSEHGLNFEQLHKLCTALAAEFSDGHFTLMKFTTNWRAGFFTPSCIDAVQELISGETAEAAMWNAIRHRLGAERSDYDTRMIKAYRLDPTDGPEPQDRDLSV